MKSIDECHDIFSKNGINEQELKLSSLYIHKYTKILFNSYNICFDSDEEHMEVTECMYKAYLNMLIRFSENIEKTNLQEQFQNTLDEFKYDTEMSKNNIYLIAGYANANSSTRTDKILLFTETVHSSQNV